MMTERILHDLTITTMGYEVSTMAILYVKVAIKIVAAHKIRFFFGIFTNGCDEKQPTIFPTVHPERYGNIRSPTG